MRPSIILIVHSAFSKINVCRVKVARRNQGCIFKIKHTTVQGERGFIKIKFLSLTRKSYDT